MIPIQIDQIEKGLGRVITSLSDKENFTKLLQIFLTQINELEEQNILLAGQKNIPTAEGVWLDYIGKIVGEDREGRGDTEYRSALTFRIGVNSSDGTPNNIISLVKNHTYANNVLLREYGKASFILTTSGTTSIDHTLFDLVKDIKPAGVSATVISNPDNNVFVPAWLTDDSETTVDQEFLLDLEDNLLLDEGDDFLNILITPADIYYNDISNSFLNWISDTEFSVSSGGSLYNLRLSTGDILRVVVSNTNSGTTGILAQVVTQNTTSI